LLLFTDGVLVLAGVLPIPGGVFTGGPSFSLGPVWKEYAWFGDFAWEPLVAAATNDMVLRTPRMHTLVANRMNMEISLRQSFVNDRPGLPKPGRHEQVTFDFLESGSLPAPLQIDSDPTRVTA
jgi:hypothetical protein